MESIQRIVKQNKGVPKVGGFEFMNFLKKVASEMRKVSWPKRKELVRYTITVVTTVAFVTIFFALIDLGISQILELF